LFARKQGALLFEDLKVDKILFRGKKTRNLSLKLEDPGRLRTTPRACHLGVGVFFFTRKQKQMRRKHLGLALQTITNAHHSLELFLLLLLRDHLELPRTLPQKAPKNN
jgi:hypothetical protein